MADITPIKSMTPSLLPDVSDEKKPQVQGVLNKVGMEKIEMPILYKTLSGDLALLPASINAFVSLDKTDAKGIHMSRLYLSMQDRLTKTPFSSQLVHELLEEFLRGHKGLSDSSYLDIDFTLPVQRKALVSGQLGWRHYRVGLSGALKGSRAEFTTSVEVVYSSTCPCSAALSRQLNSEQFHRQFIDRESMTVEEVSEWLMSEQGVAATPHAQRSYAQVKVKSTKSSDTPGFIELIDLVEEVLKTPVQAAVKRSDEQEFARLNAANLMFCEDAGRKIKQGLESDRRFVDFWAHIRHEESLHPHNAVSVISKGVENGW